MLENLNMDSLGQVTLYANTFSSLSDRGSINEICFIVVLKMQVRDCDRSSQRS